MKILPILKLPGRSSYDYVRIVKQQLKGKIKKIGHFGTLDPFASGLLVIGLDKALRLNNAFHDYLPKTYLIIGKLGCRSDTGDLTQEVSSIDHSRYFKEVISAFDKNFINEMCQFFIGEYWQAPHQYSASKFQGRALHEWSRQGVQILKPPVKRFLYHVEVVKYRFPYLSIRVTASSGTFMRTFFEDIAKRLGTYGVCVGLVRESIGMLHYKQALHLNHQATPDHILDHLISITDILKFQKVYLDEDRSKAFFNGLSTDQEKVTSLKEAEFLDSDYKWVYSGEQFCGLGQMEQGQLYPRVPFDRDSNSSKC